MMTTVYIYGLADPRDDKIRYVGKAKNPRGRLSVHLDWKRQPISKKSKWIKELWLIRCKPILKILEEVPEADWEKHEKAWIKKMSGNDLTNGTEGGKEIYKRKKTISRRKVNA